MKSVLEADTQRIKDETERTQLRIKSNAENKRQWLELVKKDPDAIKAIQNHQMFKQLPKQDKADIIKAAYQYSNLHQAWKEEELKEEEKDE